MPRLICSHGKSGIISFVALEPESRSSASKYAPFVRSGLPTWGTDLLGWLVLSIPFLYLTVEKRLFLDFWIDEVLSIVRHIEPSIRSALLWYPAPNNHVFSNALSGLYLKLIDARDLKLLFENPDILRMPYFIVGILTILCTALIARQSFSRSGGVLVVTLLCTTIPFLNYIVQIRGYSLSFLLAAALLYFSLIYRKSGAAYAGVGVFLSSGALIYTIPSNAYFILSAASFFGAAGILKVWLGRSEQTPAGIKALIRNRPVRIAVLIGLGTLAFGLFYLPILRQVIGNDVVQTLGLFRGDAFNSAFPQLMEFFISRRDWIFILAAGGILFGLSRPSGIPNPEARFTGALCLSTVLLPLLFSVIRGDTPPERTFLVSLPSFVLAGAFGMDVLINHVQGKFSFKWLGPIAIGILIVYANINFFVTYQEVADAVSETLVQENIHRIEQEHSALWASHFLEHYVVVEVIQALEKDPAGVLPILLDLENTRYPWVLQVYLETFETPFAEFASVDQIHHDAAIVLLSYPQRSLEMIRTRYPETTCVPLTNRISLYRAMTCRFVQ